MAGDREPRKPKEIQKCASFWDTKIQKLSWYLNEKSNITFGHPLHLFPLETSIIGSLNNHDDDRQDDDRK